METTQRSGADSGGHDGGHGGLGGGLGAVGQIAMLASGGQGVFTGAVADRGECCSDAELVEQIRGLQVAIGALNAAQTARIGQFAARGMEELWDGTVERVDLGAGHVDEFASDTLAPMLGMSHGPAATRVRTAAKLLADLPVTLRAVAEGDLDLFRAHVIADELRLADREVCAAVEAMIHPAVCGDTPGKARNRVRKALAKIDPELVRQRAARAKLERFVSTRASHLPGMTEWLAQLPAADSAKAWAAIDALARQQHQEDPDRTLDQHRADALLDLILGNATIHADLTLAIPLTPDPDTEDTDTTEDTGGPGAAGGGAGAVVPESFGGPPAGGSADGADSAAGDGAAVDGDGAGDGGLSDAHAFFLDYLATRVTGADTGAVVEIPGIGTIPVSQALAMAGDLGTRITRMLIDPVTGATVETRATGYRPPAGIARFVKLRDGTCRFPSCHRKAQSCELDHITPWPAGETAVANLICLCKHHHRLKHATAWSPQLQPDGTVDWTDPYGQHWLTHPIDHRDPAVA